MFDPKTIESQLRKLEANWQPIGEHLDDESIAAVIDGQPLSEQQAQHLLGCQECSEFLRETAISVSSAPSVLRRPRPPALTRPTPPQSRRRASAAWAVIFLAAVSFAGLRYFDQRIANDSSPISPPTARRAQVDSAMQADGSHPRDKRDGVFEKLKPKPLGSSDLSEANNTEESVIGSNVQAQRATQGQRATQAQHVIDAGVGIPLSELTGSGHSLGETGKSSQVDAKATKASPATRATGRKQLAGKRGSRKPDKRSAKMVIKEKADDGSVLPASRLQLGRHQRRMMRAPVAGPSRGFGQLRLASKPAARVIIDGRERGWTPLIDIRLQAGPHDVTLVYDSPHAAEPEQRFRVLIRADETWATVRDNRRKRSDVKDADAAP